MQLFQQSQQYYKHLVVVLAVVAVAVTLSQVIRTSNSKSIEWIETTEFDYQGDHYTSHIYRGGFIDVFPNYDLNTETCGDEGYYTCSVEEDQARNLAYEVARSLGPDFHINPIYRDGLHFPLKAYDGDAEMVKFTRAMPFNLENVFEESIYTNSLESSRTWSQVPLDPAVTHARGELVFETDSGNDTLRVWKGSFQRVFGSVQDCAHDFKFCSGGKSLIKGNKYCEWVGVVRNQWDDDEAKEIRLPIGKGQRGQNKDKMLQYTDSQGDACRFLNPTPTTLQLTDEQNVGYWLERLPGPGAPPSRPPGEGGDRPQRIVTIKILYQGYTYFVDIVRGSFRNVHTPFATGGQCGANLQYICNGGPARAEEFAHLITDSLNDASFEGSDQVHVPFYGEMVLGKIRTKSDSNPSQSEDECCTGTTIGMNDETVLWPVFLSVLHDGNDTSGVEVCNKSAVTSASDKESRISDALSDQTMRDDSIAYKQFLVNYAHHKKGDDEGFPIEDHNCVDSDYQGSLTLKQFDPNDEKEKYTHETGTSWTIDLARIGSRQGLLNALGDVMNARLVRLIHSGYDHRADLSLPPVKFHFRHQRLNDLHHAGGDSAYSYRSYLLRTTPPVPDEGATKEDHERDHDFPLRIPYGTDNEAAKNDRRYCYTGITFEQYHECRQGTIYSDYGKQAGEWNDHTRVIRFGEVMNYVWQLSETDTREPGTEYRIGDAAHDWYEHGVNPYDPNRNPGQHLMTSVGGILGYYLFSNEDDVMVAFQFEVSHGAAYSLAEDRRMASEMEAAAFCRQGFYHHSTAVKSIFSEGEDYRECGPDIETWILTVVAPSVVGTVHTKVWAEIVE